jgi:hypothetical protein
MGISEKFDEWRNAQSQNEFRGAQAEHYRSLAKRPTSPQNFSDFEGYVAAVQGELGRDLTQAEYLKTRTDWLSRVPGAGAQPAIRRDTRPDPKSSSGSRYWDVGLDPKTGTQLWERSAGEAPKPSTGPDPAFRQLGASIQLANSLKSHPAYVDMLDIDTGMQGVEVGLSQQNGFGDIAAMNAIQRMIDPGATVREGDVALIQSASALLSKIFSDYPIERLRQGDQLPQATRNQMRKTARDLYTRRAQNYNDLVGTQYRALAQGANVPFEMVGRDFAPLQPATSEPSVITTPDGKRWQQRGDTMVELPPEGR